MTDPTAPTLLRFATDAATPNNPDLPVVLVPDAVGPDATASDIQALVRSNGWEGAWLWGVFGYHHYHATAHEALVVTTGEADLLLGGESGERVTVRRGDLCVLPAGTGHKCLSHSADFQVCGSYPHGQGSPDIRREGDDRTGVEAIIAAVPLPHTDPIFGADGPLIRAWSGG